MNAPHRCTARGRERPPPSPGWRAALAAALIAACCGGCGERRLTGTAPPAGKAAGESALWEPGELKQALDRNLERARATCEQYETWCRRAEALTDRQGTEEFSAQTAAALTLIAEEAQMALARLDELASEQDHLAQEVLRRADRGRS